MSLIAGHKFSKEPNTDVPDGIYDVIFSGWEIEVKVSDEKTCTFNATSGIRGTLETRMEVKAGEVYSI